MSDKDKLRGFTTIIRHLNLITTEYLKVLANRENFGSCWKIFQDSILEMKDFIVLSIRRKERDRPIICQIMMMIRTGIAFRPPPGDSKAPRGHSPEEWAEDVVEEGLQTEIRQTLEMIHGIPIEGVQTGILGEDRPISHQKILIGMFTSILN